MDLGDYYTKSIESYRRNWKIAVPSIIASFLTVLILIVGFFEILTTLSLNLNILGTAISPSNFPNITPNAILTAVEIFIIMEALIFVIDVIRTAATVGMAKQIIMEGSSNLDFAWKSGIKYFFRIFVVSIIKFILILVVAIPLFLGIYLLSAHLTWAIPVLLIGLIIFIIGAILLALIFFIINQSIVVGQKSIIDSIEDSFHVFWDNKLTVFVVALINIIISIAFSILLGFVVVPLSFLAGPVAMQVINQVLGLIITVILVPYFALVMTYMYMDLKMGFQWTK